MDLHPNRPNQTSSFEQLRPICVHASQVALAFGKGKFDGSELVSAFAALLRTLEEIEYLDHRLADYVFFPLSQIFRNHSNYPQHSTNIALSCLNIVIARGWNETASPQLCRELIILLSFILDHGQNEGIKGIKPSDETTLSALECMGTIFGQLKRPIQDLCTELADDSFGILGKAISSVLAVLKISHSPKIQLASVGAVFSMGSRLHRKSLFVRFLPGILSALTQVVHIEIAPRRPYRVLVVALNSIRKLLELLLSYSNGVVVDDGEEGILWAANNATHLKTTLTCIIPVKKHGRSEVREALFLLCLSTLQNFREPLHDCTEMILDTLVELSAEHLSTQSINMYVESLNLLSTASELVKKLSTLLYKWSFKLPTVIQGVDEHRYQAHLGKMLMAYNLCKELQYDTPSFREKLLEHLLQCIYPQLPKARLNHAVIGDSQGFNPGLLLSESSAGDDASFTFLTTSGSKPLASIQDFVVDICSTGQPHEFLYEVTSGLSVAANEDVLSRMWIIACIYRACVQNTESARAVVSTLDGVYSKCVDIIASNAHESFDWRLEALALEIIGMYATWQSQSFNAELVEVLYPVVERLGAAQAELRNAAMACLEAISHGCGADSPRTLIIQNADYLVNAIALRFNAFDISYQSPRVLVMMIELCGPDIVPYLDDILDSIVGALESYHGYPVLVRSLVGILESIVRQSVSATQRMPGQTNPDQQKPRHSLTARHDKTRIIRDENTNGNLRPQEQSRCEPSKKACLESNLEDYQTWINGHKLGKLETMGFTVVRLTQYYVTHQSPNVRLRLLKLLTLGCDLLSSNEEKFLPLVNDVWPTTVKRLYDEDSNVKIAAIQSVTRLVECTGNFLSSRVQNEWNKIKILTRSAGLDVERQNTGPAGRGKFTEASMVWDAVLGLLVSVMQHLDITAEMEDDMFGILAFDAGRSTKLKDALEILNSDALWLCNLSTGELKNPEHNLTTPILSGVEFTPLCLAQSY